MRPDQITCHSIWVQECHGCFTEGIGFVGRPLTHPLMPSCWGRITGLEGLPNWIASLLLQPRSDNQCKGVSKRPWWMITHRSQQVHVASTFFWQVMLVRAVRSHSLRGTSYVDAKAAWTAKASQLPRSYPDFVYEHSTLPLHSNTGGTLEVAAFFWIYKVCLI